MIVLSALLFSGCICPGSGGSQQLAPNTAKAGEPISIKLRFLVTDHNPAMLGLLCNHPIPGRFKDVRLYYRLVGETDWHPLEPSKHIPQDEKIEIYEFVIPPYLEGTSGEIEWYYEYVFDGRPGKHPGANRIRLG